MNVNRIYSERARTPEEGWALLSSDPLAYIRELALAHAEKLRDGAEVVVVEVPGVVDLNAYRERRNDEHR